MSVPQKEETGRQIRRAILVDRADQCNRITKAKDLGRNRVKLWFVLCRLHLREMSTKRRWMFQFCRKHQGDSARETGLVTLVLGAPIHFHPC